MKKQEEATKFRILSSYEELKPSPSTPSASNPYLDYINERTKQNEEYLNERTKQNEEYLKERAKQNEEYLNQAKKRYGL